MIKLEAQHDNVTVDRIIKVTIEIGRRLTIGSPRGNGSIPENLLDIVPGAYVLCQLLNGTPSIQG